MSGEGLWSVTKTPPTNTYPSLLLLLLLFVALAQ